MFREPEKYLRSCDQGQSRTRKLPWNLVEKGNQTRTVESTSKRHVKETETYRRLFGWAPLLLVRLSFRTALKDLHGEKPKLWEQVTLHLLSRLAPRRPSQLS